MDYLNYNKPTPQKRVQNKQAFGSDLELVQKQQPKKPQPQGFGIDEKDVKLSKEDFVFGNLKDQKLNSPQAVLDSPPVLPLPDPQTYTHELVKLFPTPVLVCKCIIDYSKEEKWCRDYDCTKENCVRDQHGKKLKHHNRQSEDAFILDNPEMKGIRAFIQEKIDFYSNKVYNFSDKLVITQSWLNKNGKGELHHPHRHPNSIISGVWYPLIHRGLPPIQFQKPEDRDISMHIGEGKLNAFNSYTFNLSMNKGDLVLFPSHLQHSVPENIIDEERISLSFNTWAKGSLGNKNGLAYLPMDRCV